MYTTYLQKDNYLLWAAFWLCFIVLLAFPEIAFAQDTSWIDPAIEIVESLESGLGRIAAVAVSLGLIAIGVWGAITGSLNFMKIGMMVGAAFLVAFGPQIILGLFGLE